MTGNRALLKIAGRIIGVGVQNVNFQDSYGRQRVDGLGDGRAQELPPGQISYTISLSSYFIPNQRLSDLGIVPDAEAILTAGGLDIELQDKITGQTVEQYSGCFIDTHSRNYPKLTLSGSDATFQCLRKLE